MIKLVNESDGRKQMRKRGIRESVGGTVVLKNMNTDILPVVDFGCYWGSLKDALDDVFVSDYVELDNIDPEDNYYYDEIVELVNDGYDGTDDFFDQVLRMAPATIQKAFDEYEIKMTVVPSSCKWYHPREYNFGDDEIVFDTTVDTKWLESKFIEFSRKSDFSSYLKKEFSSRDGFISFMPNDVDSYNDLLDPSSNEYYKVVSAVVGYIISEDTSIRRDVTEEMYEELIGNPDYATFSSYEIY